MKYIIGRKAGMTQRHNAQGVVIPVTAVHAGPCVVTQVKTKEKDGYTAIQFGFGEKKHPSKPLAGHIRNLPNLKEGRGYALLKEIRTTQVQNDMSRGDVISVSSFSSGDRIELTGWSKGRGYAGVVKRHHFHGHPPTHGHKDQERMPGSIGAGGVQHVFKGVRMAGRMGNQQVTVKKLEIIDVDSEKNILYVKGAVPGARNGFVTIFSEEGSFVIEKPSSSVQSQSQDVQSETGVQGNTHDQQAEDQMNMDETITQVSEETSGSQFQESSDEPLSKE